MNAEKYVSQIVKRVKCSTAKRKEIKKQLLSDVSVHLENGETIEQIRITMGTPEEIAEEFNQNLSEQEQKAYKRNKNIKIIAIVALICCVMAGYAWWLFPKTGEIGEKGNYTKETVEQEVEKIIVLLNQNDYDALRENASVAMQSVLNTETMDKAKKQINVDWGEMQSMGTIYAQEVTQQGQLFAVTQVNVSYENVDVVYTISFDEDMKLAGIYMK